MIFVTTGTHEQQFNRLVSEVDRYAAEGLEEVFIQFGYETSSPLHAKGDRLLTRNAMDDLMQQARIIVTHGGPGSIWGAFEHNKVPIVVPRQAAFDEHVDNHQLLFCRRLAKSRRVLLVENIADLIPLIRDYDARSRDCFPPAQVSNANRQQFCGLLDREFGR